MPYSKDNVESIFLIVKTDIKIDTSVLNVKQIISWDKNNVWQEIHIAVNIKDKA